MLLEAGADPLLKNDQGLSPLQISVQTEHSSTTTLLRESAVKRRREQAIQRGRMSGSSSRSSLETIVETSPVLTQLHSTNQSVTSSNPVVNKGQDRSNIKNFASCELTDPVDTVLEAPSPSPSIVSEPPLSFNVAESNIKRPSHSQMDVRNPKGKTFFQWTLSSLKKSSIVRRSNREIKLQ